MTAKALQHAVRLWQSINTPLHRNKHWIEDTLRSTAVGPKGMLEFITMDSSPNGITLDAARRYSGQLSTSLAITTLKVIIIRIMSSFNLQLKMALTYRIPRLDFGARAVNHAACASIIIYAPLSATTLGNLRRLSGARAKLFRLEPRGLCRHIDNSKIVERVTLRLRSKLYGAC